MNNVCYKRKWKYLMIYAMIIAVVIYINNKMHFAIKLGMRYAFEKLILTSFLTQNETKRTFFEIMYKIWLL